MRLASIRYKAAHITAVVFLVVIFLFLAVPNIAYAEDDERSEIANMRIFSDLSSYVLDDMPLSQYPQDIIESIPFVDSVRACILDKNGNMLLGKNSHEKCKIASVTKIMTALVAADYPMDMRIRVSANAASIPGSFAGIMEGDECDLYEMIDGLMLPSGNDAAYAIAENLGRTMLIDEGRSNESNDISLCIGRFVEEMNNKAYALGMTDTFFANPCGLDDEGFEGSHESTAYDVALMMRAAGNTYPVAEIMAKREDTLSCIRGGVSYELPLVNTNKIMKMEDNACGGKTGFTDLAGRCVATNFIGDDETRYSIAVLGAPSSVKSFADSIKLFRWINTSSRTFVPFAQNNMDINNQTGAIEMADIAIDGHLNKTFKAGLNVASASAITDRCRYWDGEYAVHVQVDEANRESVSAGDIVGTVELLRVSTNEIISTQDLIALETVDEPSLAMKYAMFAIEWLKL